MADDYRRRPLEMQKGILPRAGQVGTYYDGNGEYGEKGALYDAHLAWVSPDRFDIQGSGENAKFVPNPLGRYTQCSGHLYYNGNKNKKADTLVSNPVAMDRDSWLLDLQENLILGCPCTPPLPAHCP